MSTRSTVHFIDEYDTHIVYVHHDGYLSGRGEQLLRFIDRLQSFGDPRLGDAGGVAARFIGFMLEEYQSDLGGGTDFMGQPRPERDPLETISVRVCSGDPGDIEFRYLVRFDKVTYQTVRWVASAVTGEQVYSEELPVTPENVK